MLYLWSAPRIRKRANKSVSLLSSSGSDMSTKLMPDVYIRDVEVVIGYLLILVLDLLFFLRCSAELFPVLSAFSCL